jgi:hypothetical protein
MYCELRLTTTSGTGSSGAQGRSHFVAVGCSSKIGPTWTTFGRASPRPSNSAGITTSSVRSDAPAIDIIITGAFLTTPLPNVPDWDQFARRQARIFLAGLASSNDALLPGSRPTRQHLEEGFSASMGRRPRR